MESSSGGTQYTVSCFFFVPHRMKCAEERFQRHEASINTGANPLASQIRIILHGPQVE